MGPRGMGGGCPAPLRPRRRLAEGGARRRTGRSERSNRVASAPAGREERAGDRGGGRRAFRRTLGGIGTEETPPGGSCHVSFLSPGGGRPPRAFPPPAAPFRVFAVSGAGDPGCPRVAPEGSGVLEPGHSETGPGMGAARPRADRGGGAPGRAAGGGWGPGALPPEVGEAPIALVGRASRSFFEERVEVSGAHSTRTHRAEREGLAAGFTARRVRLPALRGSRRPRRPPRPAAQAGPGRRTPTAGRPRPLPWERLAGETIVSRNGRD